MSMNKEIYTKARNEIQARRAEAQMVARQRREECKRLYPEIAKAYRIMAETASECVKALGLGGKAQSFIDEISKKNLEAQQVIRDTLKKANLPEDYLQEKYSCSLCDDTGFVDGLMCECLRNTMRQMTYNALCDKLPIEKFRFDNFSLDNYSDKPDENGVIPRNRMSSFFSYCKNYAEDFSKESGNILMFGDTGLGKTHLSLAIAGVAAQKGYSVIYGSAQNLISNIENEKFGRSTSVGAEQSIHECDLLIIDDLGAEFSTQFTVSAVYNIINTRLMQSKPTIISTNFDFAEIEDRYTQRVASRILGDYTIMNFKGKDVRVIKRNK